MSTITENELDARDAEWQRYAVRLASRRVAFAVVGLSRLDHNFCQIIKDRFDLDALFDQKSGQMHFIPRNLPGDYKNVIT
jgi:hypothetical protein